MTGLPGVPTSSFEFLRIPGDTAPPGEPRQFFWGDDFHGNVVYTMQAMRSVLNQNTLNQDYVHREASPVALGDDDLFILIAKGDEPALAELYKRYRVMLYQFISYMVHDAAAAEEVLQDVMLAAWQRAGKFRGASSVKTWLFRVAYNRAATWLSRRKPETYVDVTQIPGNDHALDELMFQRWQAGQIREAVSRLSPKHRAIIELVFFHQLSYEEASEVIARPVGTVKSRMSYALRHLQFLLRTAKPGIE